MFGNMNFISNFEFDQIICGIINEFGYEFQDIQIFWNEMHVLGHNLNLISHKLEKVIDQILINIQEWAKKGSASRLWSQQDVKPELRCYKNLDIGRSLSYHSILECNPRLFITTLFMSKRLRMSHCYNSNKDRGPLHFFPSNILANNTFLLKPFTFYHHIQSI